ncbi:hypothetical protein [Pseudanabaena sp. 'Roaring Creek']|uniref:hypothetical protein n=1 Tax=Pseudanabaena sp. 'Roaring Creek' TaxID=1681830 RepID=UPI0006D818D1|nr:hypothetical protein [Pseudanabaena sp. 'Roaring Creek']
MRQRRKAIANLAIAFYNLDMKKISHTEQLKRQLTAILATVILLNEIVEMIEAIKLRLISANNKGDR